MEMKIEAGNTQVYTQVAQLESEMVYALESTCIFMCIAGLCFLSPTYLGCPVYNRGCLRWSYQHATKIQIVPVSDSTNVCALPPEIKSARCCEM